MTISKYLDDITTFVQEKFEGLENAFIEKSLEIELQNYFKNAINVSTSLGDIKRIEQTLNEFKYLASRELLIQDFLIYIKVLFEVFIISSQFIA